MTLQNIKISLRSDSLENWISSDPVLKNGELVMVNDISAGLVRFKIGNGVSAFVQLPYVNEKKVITDFAKAKRTESQYFSQGVNNFTSPLGFAAGSYLTADSSFAQVLGINACAPEGHDYSFVWNGDGSGTIGVQSYRSHGEGTFNVNPADGVNGFYVGNQTLSGILSSTCQPKGSYLSSNALDGYRTYDNTVTSLTAQSGFKTYADTKSSLSVDGYLTAHQPISAAYVGQHIMLSANGQLVGDIDCNDFIKDGMLSTVELRDTVLVMKFNTDAGSDPISVELSNFVDNYDSKIDILSDAIDKKIFISDSISGISGYSDLSVVKLSADEYAQMLGDGTCLSNAIYIVEAPNIDAFKQRITNVAPPTDLSDAATKEYVDNALTNVQIPTDLSAFTNSPGYTTNVGTITGITMNGASKGTSGNVNLGTVLTAH